MSLERLTAHGDIIGEKAAVQARDQILARADTAQGVSAEPVEGGIALTGKGLRRRMLDDPQLRNFGQ